MAERIAFITPHDSANYGSCLQAYATQCVFEYLGYDVTVINYIRQQSIPKNAVSRILDRGQRAKSIPVLQNPIVRTLAKLLILWLVNQREKPLRAFREKWLNLSTNSYYSEAELEKNPPLADIYCTGSDQVWNSSWNGGFDEPYFLRFAPAGSTRIAFSSSIGKEAFEEWEVPLVRDALAEYSFISVREFSAINALREIGIDGVTHFMDPTLMLEPSEWNRIASDKHPDEPYILVYQLNNDNRMASYVRRFMKYKGMKAYKITYGIHERGEGCKPVVCPTVEEFVALLAHAEYVITDSFHGTAFSANLGKKFASFVPERFGTRIIDFLCFIGAENHIVVDADDLTIPDALFDWAGIERVLRSERESNISQLSAALQKNRGIVVKFDS